MADDDREGLLRLGDDYVVDRYARFDPANPDDWERDAKGHVIWNEGQPPADEWNKVGLVTINYDPEGEGKYRNIPISPDRPLDPFNPPADYDYPWEFFYDIDDLATQMDWSLFSP